MVISDHEFQNRPPRFLEDTAREYSLEEILDRPIDLQIAPWDVVSTSPTPLDPYHVKVHGIDYIRVAPIELTRLESEGRPDVPHTMLSGDESAAYAQRFYGVTDAVLEELQTSHNRSVSKNQEAFTRLRELAATDPKEHTLTHSRAEGLMQVRAGVAKLATVYELLKRYPQMEALEVSRAGRPYSIERFKGARGHVRAMIGELARRSSVSVKLTDAGSPYRHIYDNGVVIAKSQIASISENEGSFDAVVRERDSYLFVDEHFPGHTIKARLGSVAVSMLPIATTSYLLASTSEHPLDESSDY